MAVNRWKKYVIGMSSVALIGGAVGLAQKIDSFHNPVATNPALDTSGNVQSPTQDAIQQEFAVEPTPSATATPNVRPTARPIVRETTSNKIQPRVVHEFEEDDNDEYAWEEREHEEEFEGEHHHREHGEYERQSYGEQQNNASSTRIRSQAS